MMTTLAISGYRSLRDVGVTLGGLNVVTGANGSGKSSLYRALRLLAEIAQGRVVQSLAQEGGLHSTLWAGPEAFSREMKAGRQPIHELLLQPPEYVETAKVFDLLLAVPKYGRVKVNKILSQCRISPSKTIGGLSERQRRELVALMRRR